MDVQDPGISNESPGNYTPFDEGDLLDIWVKNPDGVTPEEAVVSTEDYAEDTAFQQAPWQHLVIRKNAITNPFHMDSQ